MLQTVLWKVCSAETDGEDDEEEEMFGLDEEEGRSFGMDRMSRGFESKRMQVRSKVL